MFKGILLDVSPNWAVDFLVAVSTCNSFESNHSFIEKPRIRRNLTIQPQLNQLLHRFF